MTVEADDARKIAIVTLGKRHYPQARVSAGARPQHPSSVTPSRRGTSSTVAPTLSLPLKHIASRSSRFFDELAPSILKPGTRVVSNRACRSSSPRRSSFRPRCPPPTTNGGSERRFLERTPTTRPLSPSAASRSSRAMIPSSWGQSSGRFAKRTRFRVSTSRCSRGSRVRRHRRPPSTTIMPRRTPTPTARLSR